MNNEAQAEAAARQQMRIDIVTIFPEMIRAVLSYGVLGRAQESGTLQVEAHDLRAYTTDRHRKVDDYPYGGAPGMLLKPEPLFRAIRELHHEDTHVVMLTPQGKMLTQQRAEHLSLKPHLILVCGRYKGVDERVRERLVHEEISVGDYILSGGELPALVLVDALARVLPGVLGDYDSAQRDSFSDGLLDAPYYTRPALFESHPVPPVLLSGDHARVRRWQREQSLMRTAKRRPELLAEADLTQEDLDYLKSVQESKDEPD